MSSHIFIVSPGSRFLQSLVNKLPIADFSKVGERARIREVLHEWGQFLHEEHVPYEGDLQKRYHVYHASFHDFIAKKEEVGDERVSRKEAHKKIADVLWSELFGDE